MPGSTSPAGPEKVALWTKNFVLVMLLNFFLFTGYQMLPVALPPWVKSLGAPDSALGWIMGISISATLLMRPFAGAALDRLGRRGVFFTGIFIMAISTTGYFFFPVVGFILAIRFLHGLGWGISNTASNTIASDIVPKSRFGEGMGYWSLSMSMAMAVAPAIALSLKPDVMLWTSTAFLAVTLCAAPFVRYRKIVREPKKERKFVFPYEKASIMPALIMMMITVTYGAIISFTALYAAQRGIANIGMFFTVYAAALLLARPMTGKIVDKHGFGVVMLPSVVIVAVALLVLAQAESMSWFLFSAALYGVGKGAIQTSTQPMAILAAPSSRFGAANATYFTGFDAGIALGAVAAGMIASAIGYSGMFLLLILCPVIAGALYLLTARHGLRRPAES